jgi:hypothetical protein
MKYIKNYGITKEDIDRGFTEGRSEAMIEEEEEREAWACVYKDDEKFEGGFLGRGRIWER